jgi:hypothetical protein
MKSGYKLGVFSIVVVLLLIALIQAAQKTPLDWNPTYNPNDKIPFGTYVLYHDLKTIFPENKQVTGLEESVYTYFDREKPTDRTGFLFVGSEFEVGKVAINKLLQFAYSGHDLFISAKYLPDELLDTLKITVTNFSNHKAGVDYKNDSSFFSSGREGQAVYLDKIADPMVFSSLTMHCRILGYFQRGGVSVPNFVEVRFGRGKILLHLGPKLFTNYYLLKEPSYELAIAALHQMDGKRILWYDGQFARNRERSPLRFILSQPALKWAWYILLFALLAFLIFKSKREQKAIPIIDPEPNLSVAFAETIGSLYYENGTPGNMVRKKIEYFLFELRRRFHLNTEDLADKKLVYLLSQRVGMHETEVSAFLNILTDFKSRESHSEQDLKYLNNLIEQFKQKFK